MVRQDFFLSSSHVAAAGWPPYLPAARMRECATIGLQDYPTQLHLPIWPPNSPSPLLEIHTPPPFTLSIHREKSTPLLRLRILQDETYRMAAMTAASSAVSRSAFFGAVAKENGLQKRVGACQAKLSMVTYHTSPCNFSVTCSIHIQSISECGRLRHLLHILSHYLQMYMGCRFRGPHLHLGVSESAVEGILYVCNLYVRFENVA